MRLITVGINKPFCQSLTIKECDFVHPEEKMDFKFEDLPKCGYCLSELVLGDHVTVSFGVNFMGFCNLEHLRLRLNQNNDLLTDIEGEVVSKDDDREGIFE